MPKATVERIMEEGWRPDQFGGGFAAPDSFGTYLTTVLDEAGRWAAAKFGAVPYAAVQSGTYTHDCLVRAEVCAANATLWKRRASFLDSGAAHNLQSPAYLERREYLAHADAAMQCAVSNLAEAMGTEGVDPSGLGDWSGFATGVVESGRYPPVVSHG